MKWAIQATILESWKTDEWAEAAIAAGQDVRPVYIRYFEDDIDNAVDFDLNEELDVIWFGSTKLIKIISRDPREFTPGVFFNDRFDYTASIEDNGQLMLNHDAEIMDLDDVTHEFVQERGNIFVRPVLDLKAFTGGVVTSDFTSYQRWEDQLRMGGAYVSAGIDVVVAAPKQITAEYRCFCVGDKYPQIQQYQSNTLLCSKSPGMLKEFEIIEFLKKVKPPHEVCVIDVADTPDGMYVIEFNTFNGSGTYGHDCNVIVQQLIEYADDKGY